MNVFSISHMIPMRRTFLKNSADKCLTNNFLYIRFLPHRKPLTPLVSVQIPNHLPSDMKIILHTHPFHFHPVSLTLLSSPFPSLLNARSEQSAQKYPP